MSNLQYRQEKIQEKRKQTPWRDFVMEICSWMPVMFYNINGRISRFPKTGREGNLLSITAYPSHHSVVKEYESNFLFSLQKLFLENPKMILQQWFDNENSNYAEAYGAKNAYLSFGVGQYAENILYSTNSHSNITNVFNSLGVVENCENIYSSKIITQSYNIFFSNNIHNSNNIRFSSNLLGCFECIQCNGLENTKYCIENKNYDKEEYMKIKEKILRDKDMFSILHQKSYQYKADNKICYNVTGNGLIQSNNVENGYFAKGINYGRNVYIGGGKEGGELFYDCFDAGNQKDENLYATHYVGETSSHVYCCSSIANSNNIYYSYYLESCSFCLGCIGLKNKSYCILNKQYTKEERYEKVDEIFGQMERDGMLGAFFPASMNPFYFNDTAAYLIDDSFTKAEVTARGYLRRDEPIKVDIPEGAKVVKTSELDQYEGRKDLSSGGTRSPAENKSLVGMSSSVVPPSEGRQTDYKEGYTRWIDPEILKVIIQDEQGNVYKIVKMEYDFLMKYGLPLPRKHRLDRMKENFKI